MFKWMIISTSNVDNIFDKTEVLAPDGYIILDRKGRM